DVRQRVECLMLRHGLHSPHFGGRAQNGALDPHVAHAAAEVAVHVRDQFSFGGIGVLGQQGGRLHDLPRLAVTALRNLLGDPRALERMLALGIETFDGGDFCAGRLRYRGLAGAYRSPLRWTVQAPHKPAPQPNFVPVICKCSRMTHNRGVSFGTSTEWSCPFTFRVTILPPMAVLFRSRTAASTPRRRRFSAAERRAPPCAA